MKIIVFDEESVLDEYVGKHIVDFISNHNQPVIGFATGSTPLGIYDYFIKEYNQYVMSNYLTNEEIVSLSKKNKKVSH